MTAVNPGARRDAYKNDGLCPCTSPNCSDAAAKRSVAQSPAPDLDGLRERLIEVLAPRRPFRTTPEVADAVLDLFRPVVDALTADRDFERERCARLAGIADALTSERDTLRTHLGVANAAGARHKQAVDRAKALADEWEAEAANLKEQAAEQPTEDGSLSPSLMRDCGALTGAAIRLRAALGVTE